MSRLSNPVSLILLCLTVAIGCSAGGPAAAEDAVLLASTVPGYMPGMVVSSTDQLRLPDGASATLLFQSGDMLSLRGPFEGPIGQQRSPAASGGVAMLAGMLRTQGIDATVIGATRSAGSSARALPSLDDVEIDPQRSGTYCVDASTSVWIKRPSDQADVYALRRKGSSRALKWSPGMERIEWPMDVEIEDGSQYEIITGSTARGTLTFRTIPQTTSSLPAWIASGLILGCHEQFDGELARLHRSVARPKLWVTTDNGRRPTYHAGSPISLTVTADSDGFLYCVATADDGSARPVFPAGAVNGARLSGSVPLSIPGLRQSIGLVATAGLDQIRCWLADRDITPELPHALLGAPSARLPDPLAGDLDAVFGRVNATQLAVDALTVKID